MHGNDHSFKALITFCHFAEIVTLSRQWYKTQIICEKKFPASS